MVKFNETKQNGLFGEKNLGEIYTTFYGGTSIEKSNNKNEYGYAVFNPSKANQTTKNVNNGNKYGYAVFNPSKGNSTVKNTNNVNSELQQKSFNANNVFANFNLQQAENINGSKDIQNDFGPIEKQKAMTKQGLWSKIRAFLFQEIDLTAPIKVELTPYQQKVEDEINEFLHQEVSFKGISKFFGFKK